MRRVLGVLMALGLSACAYPEYVNDDYRFIPLTNFAYENSSYRIFDKPSASKLIITPSLGVAMSDSVLRQVTFGRYKNTTPREQIEAAADAFLKKDGRQCTIVGGSMVYDPQWEFSYVCDVKYTVAP